LIPASTLWRSLDVSERQSSEKADLHSSRLLTIWLALFRSFPGCFDRVAWYGPQYAPAYPLSMSLDTPGPLKKLLQETATKEDDLVHRIDQLQCQLQAVRGTRRVAEEAQRGIQELLELPGIRQALHDGYLLNAFKGRCGLRVVRLGTPGTRKDLGEGMSIAYGEHPHVEGAWSWPMRIS